jgi:hypothetical protein
MVFGISPELRLAKIHRTASPVGEFSLRVRTVERPNIEIIYAPPRLNEMLRGSLAKGKGKKSIFVNRPECRVPPEKTG